MPPAAELFSNIALPLQICLRIHSSSEFRSGVTCTPVMAGLYFPLLPPGWTVRALYGYLLPIFARLSSLSTLNLNSTLAFSSVVTPYHESNVRVVEVFHFGCAILLLQCSMAQDSLDIGCCAREMQKVKVFQKASIKVVDLRENSRKVSQVLKAKQRTP